TTTEIAVVDNIKQFNSFAEFYPYYLSEHSNSTCRRLHFVGTTLLEIAYLLGFADPSNFFRAFRRWFDATPGEYRARLQESGVAISDARMPEYTTRIR
ncbi:Mpo1-like protein, partial [Pseudomonas chlororaphis]|uniref:Mpo1-like protein n=1 Tax=Pseudomonas chlororaphis TaxID=587753 RepID=UPI001B33403E